VKARIGFATGYDPAQGVSDFAEAVSEVDRRGWEIAFFSETIGLLRDSVTALAAFAGVTTRVTLGCTQVVRLRSPVLMAQTIASLDELSGGRVVVCPGACTRGHAEKHGLDAFDPPAALREWIEVIRLLLAGQNVSYQGSMVQGLTAAGTPDDVVVRIQRYRDAGVKLPIVRPAGAHQTRRIIDLFS
jgi:alkanesulfonate monooxygenase SsuD/methylene tetrahydromethanopterin reductase-like flavin-dependent oxidoreductase (luciferase family)